MLVTTTGLGKAGRQGAPAQAELGGREARGVNVVLLLDESASGPVSLHVRALNSVASGSFSVSLT